MGLEFFVTLADGETLVLQIPPRNRRMQGGGPPGTAPYWLRPPYGFLWMLALVGIAVALGVYPIIRKLTQRLEALQRGVQRWGDGDLSTRMPVQGQDEVAVSGEAFQRGRRAHSDPDGYPACNVATKIPAGQCLARTAFAL